ELVGAASKRVDYAPDLFTEEALSFIERQTEDRPFFLYLPYNYPHPNCESWVLKQHGAEVPDYGLYADKDWPVSNLLQADGVALDVVTTLEDRSTAPDMDWIHYQIGDSEVYFLAELAGKPLAIELGAVKDVGIARVKMNRTDLGVVWRPPFRVDVTKAVKPGENELEIEVVNSWRNRLIGDRELPEGKSLTRTNISVTKDWRLEASGLLGPVTLNIYSTR
ncbi:MAG: hypothetical protein HQ582_14920, partial [Planctomycetes bacterium]|nr:hypothetical protein [Planctomycetota bacterium]